MPYRFELTAQARGLGLPTAEFSASGQLDRDQLSWLRAYCPVGEIGGSVLLYRLVGPPDASPGPTMPASPCDAGEPSTRS